VSRAGFSEAIALSAAMLISSSTSLAICFSSDSLAISSWTRKAASFAMGSRVLSAVRSSAVLYSFSSSENECEYGLMTLAWTNAGPLRDRA
jgi:hypothetical protein